MLQRGKHSRSLDLSEALDPPPSDSEARLVPRQVPLHPVHRIYVGLRSKKTITHKSLHKAAEICDYACIACIVVSPIEWKNLTHQYSPASPTSTPRNNRTKQMNLKTSYHVHPCIHVSTVSLSFQLANASAQQQPSPRALAAGHILAAWQSPSGSAKWLRTFAATCAAFLRRHWGVVPFYLSL